MGRVIECSEMEKDMMESMLRELIKIEEKNNIFFLTLRERREFQAYVERLIEGDTKNDND